MKKSTIWLIDIDGTVCEDIPNEESYRFREAKKMFCFPLASISKRRKND